jgi:uncharacterized membrane protein
MIGCGLLGGGSERIQYRDRLPARDGASSVCDFLWRFVWAFGWPLQQGHHLSHSKWFEQKAVVAGNDRSGGAAAAHRQQQCIPAAGAAQAAGELGRSGAGHLHVSKNDGGERIGLQQRERGIAGFGGGDGTAFGFQQHGEQFAAHLIIVDEEHAGWKLGQHGCAKSIRREDAARGAERAASFRRWHGSTKVERMAEERDPAHGSGQVDSSSRATLEARVARLEQAMAALERQIAGATAPAEVRKALPAEPVMRVPKAAAAVSSASAPPPPMPPRPSMQAPKFAAPAQRRDDSAASLESRIGGQLLNRIAIVALLLGTAYGLKLAVDRGWLGPMARVAIGLIAGAALVLWSERFRAKGFAAFSYSLKAVGSGVLYLSLWAAFRAFDQPLIPASVALLLMIGVTAWNAFMAWAQDSELLAAYALAGGFATPLLLSTGGNHEIFLFTYVLAIDVATVTLVRLRGWPRLLLGAFPLTVGYFVGWYLRFWTADELIVTSTFIALFAAVFASVPVGRRAADSVTVASRALKRNTLLEDILLPLCNAAFAALAGYSVLQDSGHHDLLPWLMVALAAVYLGLMRAPQTRTASAIHLSLAVVLLTIAVPLKASGHWITVSWLVEGLALMWVASRLAGSSAAEAGDAAKSADAGTAHAASVLRPLAAASLLLGFCGVCVHAFGLLDFETVSMWNQGTGTALTGVAVFAAVVRLATRTASASRLGRASWTAIATGALMLIDVIAAILTLRELGSSWRWEDAHPALRSADFVTALIGLAVFAGVIAVSLRLAREDADDDFWPQCGAFSTIAFNLVAVLTGVREVSAAFAVSPGGTNVDAALQQALAISAWLMLYGAGLLVAGFWRRSSFLRWQALALLAITILKAFLYDMRDLSGGYRFVSLIALGGLLMAVSFAYQKDWLNLRGSSGVRAGDAEAAADGAAPPSDEAAAESGRVAR